MLQISIHIDPETPLRPSLNSAHAMSTSLSNATGKDVEVTVYDDMDTFTFTACFKTGVVTETREFK